MAVFDPLSRYVGAAEPYDAMDTRGRAVKALAVPDAPVEFSIGKHVRKQGQRLDHLANGYLGDANGYWRIAELNDAMLPDALAEVETVRIPTPTR